MNNKLINRNSRLRPWHPTDRDEIKKFLGTVMRMALVMKPYIILCRSKREMYGYDFDHKIMTRPSFILVLIAFQI